MSLQWLLLVARYHNISVVAYNRCAFYVLVSEVRKRQTRSRSHAWAK
jgi:hypothetical protein